MTALKASLPTSCLNYSHTPPPGSALETEFLLRTFAWEDDVDDLPLTYVFSYVSGSANGSDVDGEVIVRASLETSEASDIYLPQVMSGREKGTRDLRQTQKWRALLVRFDRSKLGSICFCAFLSIG